MKAYCHWVCAELDCRSSNLTPVNTADGKPRDLVCWVCKKPQHVRLTLVNYVKER